MIFVALGANLKPFKLCFCGIALWMLCGDVPVLWRLFSFPDWFFMRAHGLG